MGAAVLAPVMKDTEKEHPSTHDTVNLVQSRYRDHYDSVEVSLET